LAHPWISSPQTVLTGVTGSVVYTFVGKSPSH
jgi:hypothetical protein